MKFGWIIISGLTFTWSAIPHGAFAQELLTIDAYCLYDGNEMPAQVYGFESAADAQSAVKRILDHTGLNQNFTIRAANVDNAAAVIQGQQLTCPHLSSSSN